MENIRGGGVPRQGDQFLLDDGVAASSARQRCARGADTVLDNLLDGIRRSA